LLDRWVAFVKEAGVVEVFIDPGFYKFEIPEVDDKAVSIGLAASKAKGDAPVVTVDECAMSLMQVLAVRKRDVAVGFFTGEHVR